MRLESTTEQPKILRKMVTRFAILAVALGLIIFGFTKFREVSQDIDLPAANNTAGFIAAIQVKETGSQVVIFKPDGTLLPSPGWRDEVADGEPSWRPDGNRLFFVSNREDNAQNVFRWNIDGNAINRRTIDSRSKSAPIWLPPAAEDASKTGLVVTGKLILEFNATEATMRQIVPPIQREMGVSDADRGGPAVSPLYQRLQDTASFKSARMSVDRRYVYAVMRQENDEILIVQDLFENKGPVPIASADQIEIDVHPVTGVVVFAALNYRLFDPSSAPPEFIQADGSIKLPFRHLLAMYDPSQPPESAQKLIVTAAEDDSAFRWPKCAPDGESVVLQVGTLAGPSNFKTKGLIKMPIQEGAGANVARIYEGAAMEHSWSPDSKYLVFVQTGASGERSIYQLNADGSELKNLTEGKGNFALPVVSPQIP